MRRLAILLAALAASGAVASDNALAQLFADLQRQRPGRALFEETQYLAMLDAPLRSKGELRFTPPDRLEKRTTAPRAERVVVDRDRVTLERDGKVRSLGLRENPAVAVLVESIRATLAGDLAALTRTYSAALDARGAGWKLTLRPLDASLTTLVERIEIGGSGARVERVEIFQPDGDRSVMTIVPAAP